MLTELEVGHYRAFGFILLKDCLEVDHLHRLEEAFEHTMATDPRVFDNRDNGTRNLVYFAHLDDAFAELAEHPAIMEAMRDIDGTEFLYVGEDMSAYLGETVWHCDFRPPHHTSRPVKATVYLDPMRAGDSALQLIPGTHCPDAAANILRSLGEIAEKGGPRIRLDPSEVPSVVIETNPRDVLLWQNHMWHYAPPRRDGRPRRALFFQYYHDPLEDVIAARAISDIVGTMLEQKDPPYVYSREQMEEAGPLRRKMAARLGEIGVDSVVEP